MIHVHSITWGRDGITTVNYTQDEDIRGVDDRPVMFSHQLVIDSDHPTFDQLTEIREAAHDLVRDVYREWFPAEEWQDRDEEAALDEEDD